MLRPSKTFSVTKSSKAVISVASWAISSARCAGITTTPSRSPTNLTLHQALDINVPIGCGDVAVFPGDVMVGDREGVVVIPAHLADEIAHEATEMT
ncbi:MAG: hypothetical protein RL509_434, partial [Pseudomonadota bacterium]